MLLMGFSLWKNDQEGRIPAYDCRLHQEESFQKKYNPICFSVKDEYELPIKYPGSNGQLTESVDRIVDKELLLEEAVRLYEFHNEERSLWEIMLTYFRGVCPVAYFDYDIDYYIRLESAASKYNSLPFEGGYLDQPYKIIQAFDVIRQEKSHFEFKKIREQKRKQKEYEKKSKK